MKLNLTRPAVVFDLETTGVSIIRDRIIEISVLKVYPDGLEETKTRRINPERPIPPESTEIHGITDEDVKDCPTFRQIAKQLYEWIKDADFIGFNSNRFDVPMLMEEFLRSGVDIDFSHSRFVDVQTIYHKMEQRTLSAAYKFYCHKDLIDAHSAEADTRATYEILQAQLDKYPEAIENDMTQLAEFSRYHRTVDYAGMLTYDDQDRIIINFGKYKGQELSSLLSRDMGYYSWVMNADFALDTKRWFTRVRNQILLDQEQGK